MPGGREPEEEVVYFVGTVHHGGGEAGECRVREQDSMVVLLLRLWWQECEARTGSGDRRGSQLGP